MRNIVKNIIVVMAIFLSINSCNSSIEPIPQPIEIELEYPTVLYPVGRAVADSIQIAISTNNFFSYIDEYGLFSFTGTFGRGHSNITDKNIAVRLAKESLLKYSKYSNVRDTTQLELDIVTHSAAPNFIDWVISFKNQKYNGIEVLNTRIIVIVQNQVSQISGHHFKDISIPVHGITPKEKLAEMLVGKKLETMCWSKIEVTLTREMVLENKIAQNIIWREQNGCIELRVTWKIPISTSNDGNISWNVWVDILSGEILLYSPTFIC